MGYFILHKFITLCKIINMLIYFKYLNSCHLNMLTFIHYVHILIGKGRVQNISRELDTIKFFKHPPYNLSHNLILSRKTWFSYPVTFGGCFLELVRKITFPIDQPTLR